MAGWRILTSELVDVSTAEITFFFIQCLFLFVADNLGLTSYDASSIINWEKNYTHTENIIVNDVLLSIS